MGSSFAQGKKAFGFCDVCGQRCDLHKLKALTVGLKVTNIRACPECWEPDHPQLNIRARSMNDPQALRNPRPDTSQAESRDTQWGWAPVGGGNSESGAPNYLVANGNVGTVTVVTT